MHDMIQAQARELLGYLERDGPDSVALDLAVWARRLVAESRAGALREAARLVGDRSMYERSRESLTNQLDALALAAEAEPGAPP